MERPGHRALPISSLPLPEVLSLPRSIPSQQKQVLPNQSSFHLFILYRFPLKSTDAMYRRTCIYKNAQALLAHCRPAHSAAARAPPFPGWAPTSSRKYSRLGGCTWREGATPQSPGLADFPSRLDSWKRGWWLGIHGFITHGVYQMPGTALNSLQREPV